MSSLSLQPNVPSSSAISHLSNYERSLSIKEGFDNRVKALFTSIPSAIGKPSEQKAAKIIFNQVKQDRKIQIYIADKACTLSEAQLKRLEHDVENGVDPQATSSERRRFFCGFWNEFLVTKHKSMVANVKAGPGYIKNIGIKLLDNLNDLLKLQKNMGLRIEANLEQQIKELQSNLENFSYLENLNNSKSTAMFQERLKKAYSDANSYVGRVNELISNQLKKLESHLQQNHKENVAFKNELASIKNNISELNVRNRRTLNIKQSYDDMTDKLLELPNLSLVEQTKAFNEYATLFKNRYERNGKKHNNAIFKEVCSNLKKTGRLTTLPSKEWVNMSKGDCRDLKQRLYAENILQKPVKLKKKV